MKMVRVILITFILLILTGCTTSIDKDIRLKGIIDACYTSIEYKQFEDIRPYLDSKVKNGEIESETANAIIKCLERTYGEF